MVNDEADNIIHGPRSENALNIGKESAKSLIELKKDSDNIFTHISNNNLFYFKEVNELPNIVVWW